MKTTMREKNSNSANNKGIFGIHHVTAITGNPQRNIKFYVDNLGLRLVKLTVNQDDPTSYHLYYGDELGDQALFLLFLIGQIFQKVTEEQVK